MQLTSKQESFPEWLASIDKQNSEYFEKLCNRVNDQVKKITGKDPERCPSQDLFYELMIAMNNQVILKNPVKALFVAVEKTYGTPILGIFLTQDHIEIIKTLKELKVLLENITFSVNSQSVFTELNRMNIFHNN